MSEPAITPDMAAAFQLGLPVEIPLGKPLRGTGAGRDWYVTLRLREGDQVSFRAYSPAVPGLYAIEGLSSQEPASALIGRAVQPSSWGWGWATMGEAVARLLGREVPHGTPSP